MIEYLDLKYEQRRIRRELASIPTGRRKDTRLILRHMTLTGRIHAYEAARDALAEGRAA